MIGSGLDQRNGDPAGLPPDPGRESGRLERGTERSFLAATGARYPEGAACQRGASGGGRRSDPTGAGSAA